MILLRNGIGRTLFGKTSCEKGSPMETDELYLKDLCCKQNLSKEREERERKNSNPRKGSATKGRARPDLGFKKKRFCPRNHCLWKIKSCRKERTIFNLRGGDRGVASNKGRKQQGGSDSVWGLARAARGRGVETETLSVCPNWRKVYQ